MAKGRYEGDLIVNILDDGRRVQLMRPFVYVDSADLRWETPKSAIVDGASIPKPLWSLIGGPFEGKYRKASVIHDWYCDRRSRAWQAVHRVFYEAMLTSGVSTAQAKAMYAGVYLGGPRWSETVVHNAAIDIPDADAGFRIGGRSGPRFKPVLADDPAAQPTRRRTIYEIPATAAQLKALAKRAQTENLSLEDIEGIADEKAAKLERRVLSVEDDV